MSDEIDTFFAEEKYVSVICEAPNLPEADYLIYGLGDELKGKRNKKAWTHTGGTEGTFSIESYGKVITPNIWTGLHCELHVNDLGGLFRFQHEAKGFLGEGSKRNNSVLFYLNVKPVIARDILDSIYTYVATDDKRTFKYRIDIMNPAYGKEGVLIFQIIRAYFGERY